MLIFFTILRTVLTIKIYKNYENQYIKNNHQGGVASLILFSCSKEDFSNNEGNSQPHRIFKSGAPGSVVYEIPTDPDEALNNVAVFEEAFQDYLDGNLNNGDEAYEINSEYALWLLEAALNKNFHTTENEYRAELNTDSISFTLPVTLDDSADIGFINGYDLLEKFDIVRSDAQNVNYNLAPFLNVKLSSVHNGDITVKVQYARLFDLSGYGPDPIEVGDDHYAKVKSQCDNSGSLNAADRLTTANRSLSDILAFPWHYTVRDYEISNNAIADPNTKDIFDYRLLYWRLDPFGRLGRYHPNLNVSGVYFDDRFLGGESVSGVSNASTYQPNYCVNSPELTNWDNDIKHVLGEVKKELDGVSRVKIWAADQNPGNPSNPLTHHNCKFRGAQSGLSIGPGNPSLGNPILQ